MRIPRRCWPTYACDELDGKGWEGEILDYNAPFARVHFLHATTPRGLAYEPAELKLSILSPLADDEPATESAAPSAPPLS